MKQKTMGDSSISWTRQITTSTPHHSIFTGQMPLLIPNQQCQSSDGN